MEKQPDEEFKDITMGDVDGEGEGGLSESRRRSTRLVNVTNTSQQIRSGPDPMAKSRLILSMISEGLQENSGEKGSLLESLK